MEGEGRVAADGGGEIEGSLPIGSFLAVGEILHADNDHIHILESELGIELGLLRQVLVLREQVREGFGFVLIFKLITIFKIIVNMCVQARDWNRATIR